MLSRLCLLLTATVLYCDASDDSYYFTVEPKSPVHTVDGHRLVLNCDVSDRTHIVFHWTFDNVLLENTSRRYQNNSQLVIDPVYRQRDSGQYQCIARNYTTSYSISSHIVELDIEWIGQSATVEVDPSESSIEIGGTLTLTCNVDGSHLLIGWYRNSVRVSDSMESRVEVNKKRLSIRSLSVSDNGIYSCTVENGAGYTDSSGNFALTLQRPDISNIRQPPKDLTVNKSALAQFDCVFDGVVKVDWFGRDDGPLKNSTRRTVFPNGTLVFPKVKPGDEGAYKCVAAANEGVEGDDKGVQAYVAQLRIANLPPISRNNLFPKPTRDNKYIVKAGSTLEVFCKMKENAHPPPVVSWFNGKGEKISDGPFWLIEGVQNTHAGNYSCRAHTRFSSETFVVSLFVTVLPMIFQEPTAVTVNEGSSFQLVCSFKGSAAPLTSVSWLRTPQASTHSSVIPSSARAQISLHDTTSVLSIKNAQADEDIGSYRCQVLTDGFEPVFSETALVFVRERLKFTSKPTNQHLELKAKEKLHCRAQASDVVTIRWSKKRSERNRWVPSACS